MLRIAAGRVYDPANGIAGEVRDVCVQDGKIVADVPAHARSIDARGMVVMPGGVDIHAHIAGPAVNAARKLTPEEHRGDVLDRTAITRSGTGGTVPSTFATGYRYALLGYTTVVEAATPPLAARHTLAELRDTPVIDAAFLVLMGNNLPLFELIRDDPGRVRDAVAWFLAATGGYGVKLVNPGGVEMWKRSNGNVTSLDDEGPGVTPRRVIETIATAVHELGLPHPVHVHCNNLGVAGNWRTTLDTLQHARRPPRAPRACAVPRLRRARRRAAALGGAGARRVPRLAPGAERRRRPGDVRRRDDDDRRRAGLRRAARDHPRPLGQRRHRGRDRLRDRAVHLPRAQLRPRAAVGHRPGAVPARPRPVAARAVDRPPERRLVPELPAPDPPADGPRVPQRADRPRQQEGHAAHGAARRPRSRVHPRGDRDHHACRARAPARAARQGPPGRRRRRRHHDLRRPRRSRGDVRGAAPRHQGRAADRRGRRAARLGRRPPAAGRRRVRPGDRAHAGAALRGALHRVASRTTPCASRGCSSPRAPSPPNRDEAARRRDRRHVRRGVPDVGGARRDHRGDARAGRSRRAAR